MSKNVCIRIYNVSTQDVPICQTENDMDIELTIGQNKVNYDQNVYITTHNELSDTKTDVETKTLVSYTFKYVTAKVMTI